MTPESTHEVSALRTEFYNLFAAAMALPVVISKGKSYACRLPRVSWQDGLERLNYLCVYAYSAPDALIPKRPLILRIGVNLGADLFVGYSARKSSNFHNQTCQFYLTLLPHEMLGFLPWLINIVSAEGNQEQALGATTPYPLALPGVSGECDSLWTQAAWQQTKRELTLSYTA